MCRERFVPPGPSPAEVAATKAAADAAEAASSAATRRFMANRARRMDVVPPAVPVPQAIVPPPVAVANGVPGVAAVDEAAKAAILMDEDEDDFLPPPPPTSPPSACKYPKSTCWKVFVHIKDIPTCTFGVYVTQGFISSYREL